MTYAGTPYAKILPMRERGLEMIVICTTVLRRYVDPVSPPFFSLTFLNGHLGCICLDRVNIFVLEMM